MNNYWVVKTELQRDALVAFFKKVEIPICGFVVEWANADAKRTSEQNALLWAHAYPPIAQKLSEVNNQIITKEMAHYVCKDKFLPPVMVPRKDGTFKRYVGSTARLGKKAFGDYLEQVYAFGVELGVYYD